MVKQKEYSRFERQLLNELKGINKHFAELLKRLPLSSSKGKK